MSGFFISEGDLADIGTRSRGLPPVRPKPGALDAFGDAAYHLPEVIVRGIGEAGDAFRRSDAGRSIMADTVQQESVGLENQPYLQETIADLRDPTEAERQRENEQAAKRRAQIRALSPDPERAGWATQTLFGVGKVVGQYGVGSLVAGPVGGALVAGASTGVGTTEDLIAEGMDRESAETAGWIEGGGVAVGSLAPAALPFKFSSRLAQIGARAASGAALNVPVGMAQRAAMGGYLQSRGYDDIAARYRAFDQQAMLADGILGCAFGAKR